MPTWTPLGTLAGALLGAACALPAIATEATPATPAAQGSPQGDTAQAKRVVRDKNTGKLRAPSEEELAELLAAEKAQRLARGSSDPDTAAPALVVRQHAGGMLSAVLGQEHLVSVTATRRPNGSLARTHRHPAHEHPVSSPAQRPTE